MKIVCVYPKDAIRILRISKRQAYRLFEKIRLTYNKQKHHYVTLKEFCDYTGLDEDDIGKLL